ncbi:MAG TPA: hypothetical protein VIL65_04240 [Beijerinckiaceae bacterium]|jgi:hypothetical protein
MHVVTLITSVTLVFVLAGSVLADCSGVPEPIGAASGTPEKDTVGLACVADAADTTASVRRAPAGPITRIGDATPDSEKQTFGLAAASTR